MSVGQHENKSSYYCNFKTRSGVNPGHKSKGSTRVNVRIKIIIIIVLKSNFGVDRDKAHVTC
jgi:hypothetical protein